MAEKLKPTVVQKSRSKVTKYWSGRDTASNTTEIGLGKTTGGEPRIQIKKNAKEQMSATL